MGPCGQLQGVPHIVALRAKVQQGGRGCTRRLPREEAVQEGMGAPQGADAEARVAHCTVCRTVWRVAI